MLSAYTTNPFNVKVEAPSGEGKNWVLGKVSDLFPKEDLMNLAGMTDKAIFHRNGKLVVKNASNGEFEDIVELLKMYDSRLEDVESELESVRDSATKSARPGLINTLMSMLAHDNYETEYSYADSTTSGITTKANVIRGWPAFFYAQALDISHYKRDAEANRRFIKINPKMTQEKYKAAARLIAEKWGTSDFMYQATVVSDDEKDKARQIIREIRDTILSISGAVRPG